MDKQLISKRFSKAIATYPQEANVQRQIADKMIHLLTKHISFPCSKVIEFGCGTGIYSRMLLQALRPEELFLNDLCPDGFHHYMQSLRVVDRLEKDGEGLNLTWEVRNGIVTHTSGAWARTPEGCVVRRADHIAFLNHDIEDAITAGVLDARQLPPEAVAVLGHTKSERITTMITDLVAHSGNGKINFSPEVEAAYAVLKDFMYATVYVDKEAKREEKKVDKLISELYARLCDEPALMPNFYMQIAYNEGVDRAVTDYISGMSDEFATHLFEELFVPQKWKVL